MKQIWIYPISKKVDVSERLFNLLCIYKVFWPPEAKIVLGKKTLVVKDFTPWPPLEQADLGLKVAIKKEEKQKQDMGWHFLRS